MWIALFLMAVLVLGSACVYRTDEEGINDGSGSNDTYADYYARLDQPMNLFTQTMDGYSVLDREFAKRAARIEYFADLQNVATELLPRIDMLVNDISQVENELFAVVPPQELSEIHSKTYKLSQQFRHTLLAFRLAVSAIKNGSPEWRDRIRDSSEVLDEFNRNFSLMRGEILRAGPQ